MLHFALFGAGRAGRIHAENIASHPRAKLVYVYDIDHLAAERLSEEFGGQVVSDPKAIWSNQLTDSVIIASSTSTHVDFLREAIKSKKATYCEKPIDFDIKKVRTIVQEASISDVPILTGFRRRYIPEYQLFRKRIIGGEVGSIELIHMISRDYKPPSIKYIDESGGFLRDKTIHFFDLLCWITGELPVEVFATGSCFVDPKIGQIGDIDTVMLILRMPSGALCHIDNGRRTAYGYDERIEVFGALGMIQSKPSQVIKLSSYNDAGIINERYQDLYGQESFASTLDAFINAVEAGISLEPTLEDGFRAQLIAEASVESLQKNMPVKISY